MGHRDEAISVVIVDDDAGIRALVRALAGATPEVRIVGEAQDGVEAIEVVISNQPDVVLLDLHMPQLDGLDALPGIIAGAPSACVIVHTSDAESFDRSIRQGAHSWVMKGTPWEKIVVRMRDLVEQRGDTGKCEPLNTPNPN